MEAKSPIIIELNIKKLAKANLILTLAFLLFFIMLNAFIHKRFEFEFSIWDVLYTFIGYVLLIGLHELFHLIGFMLFGKVKYKELDYGINLELGVAYATTTKPLTNSAMKKALLLPFWTTGIIPAIIGLSIDHYIFIILGSLLCAGAVGDFYMYKELRKYPNNALVKDDPKEPKLYVYL